MKSTSLRRSAFAALLLAPVLSACGFSAQTDQVYQPTEGVLNRDGDVDILSALIVSGADGSGTLSTTLVNNLAKGDELTGVGGPGVTTTGTPVDVPGNSSVNLSTEGQIAVTGDAVVPGNFVELVLVFSSGQSTTIKVPVVTHDGDYADVPVPSTDSGDSGSEDAESDDAH